MSRVTIDIVTQPKDGSQTNYGTVELFVMIDGTNYPLLLDLSEYIGYGRFTEVVWFTPASGAHTQQMQEYVAAFNRDFTNLGGQKNLVAALTPNGIEITARNGVFSGGNYSGDILYTVDFTYSNVAPEPAKVFNFIRTTNGDCNEITYTATQGQGGTAPYRLSHGAVDLITGWDGVLDTDFNLGRERLYKLELFDANNTLIKQATVRPPRKLAKGDFEIKQIQAGEAYADITIDTVTSVSGTAPLLYTLQDAAGNVTPVQTSNSFAGITSGLYTVSIQDAFGCSISIQIEVAGSGSSVTEAVKYRYANISDYNALAFVEKVFIDDTVRPNFENTLPMNEAVSKPNTIPFWFPESTEITTQFQSSYDVNIATLHRGDGTTQDLPIILTQQNLGVSEKIDCVVFPITVITIGVYFNGGNNYTPYTTTVDANNPASNYNGGLPEWAKVGQYVTIDGIGTTQILETDLYDEDRGVMYFIVSGASFESAKRIQSNFDRHPYNIYSFDLDMADVPHCGRVVIEFGYNVNDTAQIERTFESLTFKRMTTLKDFVKIQWTSEVNFDDMVFANSGITCQMWVKGRLRPVSVSNSETVENDDRVRSIKQRHRLGMRLDIEVMNAKQWHKLCLASGIADDGEFRIENLLLVATEPPEAEEYEDSNLAKIVAEYALAGESLAKKTGEVVLNTSTGSLTAKPYPLPNIALLQATDGTYVQTADGYYIDLQGFI